MEGSWEIRGYRPPDRDALYRVCLLTGDAGGDATVLHRDDPDALGNYYVGPYLALAPEFALVLAVADRPVGYCLAVPDSASFHRRARAEWLPPLRAIHPRPAGSPSAHTPTQRIHALFHEPDFMVPPGAEAYPAHLHIDLLPEAQGRGWGRRLIERQLECLAAADVPGVHLGMAPENDRALGFYSHLGFQRLGEWQDTLFLGRRLEAA